jgi:hypothetical protein
LGFSQALAVHDADMDSLEENQVLFRVVVKDALEGMREGDYQHLVYILNELSPRDCLQAEVDRVETSTVDLNHNQNDLLKNTSDVKHYRHTARGRSN